MRWMKHARRCCPTAPSRHCTALRNQAQVTLHAHEARYSRQHVLRGFGPAAQEKLAAASVLIVGAGGLGSPAAMYLAAAGIGGLTLADSDPVDITNLHRQLLYTTPDVGRGKVEAAGDRLRSINPQCASRNVQHASGRVECRRTRSRSRYRHRRDRQLPDTLRTQRCLCRCAHSIRLRKRRAFSGTGQHLRYTRRPMLSLSFSRDACAGFRSQLRRRRCPGRCSRHHRIASGNRSDQVDHRYRDAARWSADVARPARERFAVHCRLPSY